MKTNATGQRRTSNPVLQAIAGLYGTVWLIAAIAPRDRFDWLLENLLVIAFVGVLVATYRRFAFSNLSYALIAGFLCLHAVGAHYTYSESPVGAWLQSALATERNHYDRAVHFLFGLLFALPFYELAWRGAGLSTRLSCLASFTLVLSSSHLYELIEWGAAEVIDPDAALAFLGTQGDVFDSQKDSALAMAGAILALPLLPPVPRHAAR